MPGMIEPCDGAACWASSPNFELPSLVYKNRTSVFIAVDTIFRQNLACYPKHSAWNRRSCVCVLNHKLEINLRAPGCLGCFDRLNSCPGDNRERDNNNQPPSTSKKAFH